MTIRTSSIDLAERGSGPPSALDYLARKFIIKRLSGLTGGFLKVCDPWGSWEAGDPAEDWITLEIGDPRAYRELVLGGTLGSARAYMQGRWSSDDLTGLLRLFLRNMAVADDLERGPARWSNALARVKHMLRANTSDRSRENIHAHYDLGNDLFALFLDDTMTYSAGIFESPSSNLREASVAKLDRICRKLRLKPTDHILEIGTGWGSFALHAAGRYGCRVTTTTISAEQHELATRRVRDAGLVDRVEILLRDYRDLTGKYDKLVSIEMVEAVGHEYLPVYFGKCSELLADDGAMVLQAITMPDQRYEQYLRSSDFIRHYIFPGSSVPSVGAMMNAIGKGTDLKLTDLEDIGPHYATTLRRWREAFLARDDEVRALGYPSPFIRMWEFYLSYCEAGFAERYLGTVQMLLQKPACRHEPLLGRLDAPKGGEPL